jgi:integrase
MQSSIQTVSPLRQRMLEDMRMCHLVPKTQSAYIRAVGKLAQFFGRSPDTADAEELCRFQLHLVDEGTSPITLNATITGLTFIFDVTFGRAEIMARMQSARVPHKLPLVLSKEEVARLLGGVGQINHQTALSLAYGTGLRVGEVVALEVGALPSRGACMVHNPGYDVDGSNIAVGSACWVHLTALSRIGPTIVNLVIGRDCGPSYTAPKEQPPRKLSGKRTGHRKAL